MEPQKSTNFDTNFDEFSSRQTAGKVL